VEDWQNAIGELMNGKALLLVDGTAAALAIGADKVEKRDIMAPETKQSVIGGRESFVEILAPNITLIRQCQGRIKIDGLKLTHFAVCGGCAGARDDARLFDSSGANCGEVRL
jgi:hypothetical protein